ncbi:YggN family protein [Xanthomonas sp. CFBP 8445]|uniref:YggN family protein n=1 Tax=Xanthomonas sp. CFBP 8445 TaxID=2971236 RepID=UPI0021DF95D4|nr:YggN family protein [Xanthomonas sp. CFBP 8445]UYC14301.1 YggN family protein [Xanthomonas sp. CFBP 8445]
MLLAASSGLAWADQDDDGGKHDHRPQVSSRQCGLSTPFNVLADTGGIWLTRSDGDGPREIFFHAGELSVDHRVQQVGDADAQRLLEMERETRALMPQVADLSHEVVDLSYDVLGSVVEMLTGSAGNARKIERLRTHANAYVDGTLGKGRWDQDAFDDRFEDYVETQAERFVGSITRHVLWQVMTGRGDAIGDRAERMDAALEARLDARSKGIETKAQALCARVVRLDQLQQALEYRYRGQPLRLLAASEDGATGQSTAALVGTDDTPRSNAVTVPSVPTH